MMINKKLLKLETELNGCFMEREEIVRGLLVTAVARGNMLILGAPGAAKTDRPFFINTRRGSQICLGWFLKTQASISKFDK